MIMREAAVLPVRAAQEAGIPEAVLPTAGADRHRVQQEGQAVLPEAQVQEGGVREAVHLRRIVHPRAIHHTDRAADIKEADTAKEEITAGKIRITAGGTALWVWWPQWQ